MMAERGKGEGSSADHRGPGAEQKAKDGDGLEGEVGGEEVGDTHAHKYAKHQRNADPGDELDGLARVAMFEQQQPFEADGARERTGHGSGDAELDQQRYEDQFGVARVHASTVLV